MKRIAIVVVLAACSSKKHEPPIAKGAWKPLLAAPSSTEIEDRIIAIQIDGAGIWRCSFMSCEHTDATGKVIGTFPLPCKASELAFSPSRTRLAVPCPTDHQDYEIALVDTKPGTVERFPTPVSAGHQLAVDDRGVVTGLDFRGERVSRSSPTSARSITLAPLPPEREAPPGELPKLTDGVVPGAGPWLAYTVERRDGDFAWRDDDATTHVALGGAVQFYDREAFMVRTPDGKLVEVTSTGRRTLAEAPPLTRSGAAKPTSPTDFLYAIGRWGTDGIFAVYDGIMQLRDRDGHVRTVLPIPDYEGAPMFDPSGKRAYLTYSDGRVLVWDQPL